jgi:heme/copper-type cytochrome/quinol oxidase subunit 1
LQEREPLEACISSISTIRDFGFFIAGEERVLGTERKAYRYPSENQVLIWRVMSRFWTAIIALLVLVVMTLSPSCEKKKSQQQVNNPIGTGVESPGSRQDLSIDRNGDSLNICLPPPVFN